MFNSVSDMAPHLHLPGAGHKMWKMCSPPGTIVGGFIPIRLGRLVVRKGCPVPKPRLSMKHEMRQPHLVEADANITAFSDEYDLGECTTSTGMESILLTLLHQHTKVKASSEHSSNPASLTQMLY
jgi:hypothetical protein